MERNCYYEKHAAEHQREISRELAKRTLLGGAQPNRPKTMSVALWVMPVAITIIVLVLLSIAR